MLMRFLLRSFGFASFFSCYSPILASSSSSAGAGRGRSCMRQAVVSQVEHRREDRRDDLPSIPSCLSRWPGKDGPLFSSLPRGAIIEDRLSVRWVLLSGAKMGGATEALEQLSKIPRLGEAIGNFFMRGWGRPERFTRLATIYTCRTPANALQAPKETPRKWCPCSQICPHSAKNNVSWTAGHRLGYGDSIRDVRLFTTVKVTDRVQVASLSHGSTKSRRGAQPQDWTMNN